MHVKGKAKTEEQALTLTTEPRLRGVATGVLVDYCFGLVLRIGGPLTVAG